MEFTKPSSLSSVWAVAGDRIKPDESKIQVGWQVEIPLREWENWLANRQDQAIAHFNQRGVAQWDANTRYLARKSYVQGIDGKIYRAITDSVGIQPTVVSGAWETAFVSPSDPDSLRLLNGYIAIATDITAQVNSRYYAVSSVKITLPTSAVPGDNIIINKFPSATVKIVPDSGQIETLLGKYDEVELDITDEINVTFDGSQWTTS